MNNEKVKHIVTYYTSIGYKPSYEHIYETHGYEYELILAHYKEWKISSNCYISMTEFEDSAEPNYGYETYSLKDYFEEDDSELIENLELLQAIFNE